MTDIDDFIEQHYQRLVGLMRFRVGDRHVAEDLAQDALLKLVANWDTVAVMDHRWQWLATVALNLSNNRYRRHLVAQRARALIDNGARHRAQESDDGLVALLQTVRALPRRQRQALLLRHYVGLSVNETAEAMGCAPGTVKSAVHAAIHALRTELDDADLVLRPSVAPSGDRSARPAAVAPN